MTANQDFLTDFLESKRETFIIPVYQRNYDWKLKNCQKLFEDIISIHYRDADSYFIGSIVTYPNPKQNEDSRLNEKLIIDGQQRITTVFLLLLAIRDYVTENDLMDDDLKSSIETIVFNIKTKKLKLKSVKKDDEILQNLIENNLSTTNKTSSVYQNYKYFTRAIADCGVSPHKVLKALDKLQIVNISLEIGKDNPQLIFESLNSSGVDLSGADLIRNYLLMDLPAEIQEEYYFNYWSIIEERTKFKVKDFVRDFLTLNTKKIPRKQDKEIYESFKEYFVKAKQTKREILDELLEYSQYYCWISFADYSDQDINEFLKSFNRLEVTVSYPYLLSLFSLYENKEISKKEIIEVLSTLESFLLRRIICEAPTNALNKIFMMLPHEVSVSNSDIAYSDQVKVSLVKKMVSGRFPTNKEFLENLTNREIYRMKSKNKVYLLEHIENFNNNEKIDLENLLSDKKISIEHIMPQRLNPTWKAELGKDYEEIHNKYLHNLGNLTLTGYNGPMSNKSFSVKQKKGFEISKLFLNESLKKEHKWTDEEIKSRGRMLAGIALKRWEYPKVDHLVLDGNYEPDYYELTDYEAFSGKKVDKIVFYGNEYKIRGGHWRKMYEIVCKELFKLDPQLFVTLEQDPEFRKSRRKYISTNIEELSSPIEISEGVFVEGNIGSYYICKIIIELLNRYDWDETDFQIYLKNDDSDEDE